MYGRRPDDSLPKSPDDFTVVEIHDPVGGFEYILDPVTHVVHRMAIKPGAAEEFTTAGLPTWGASSFTRLNGVTLGVQMTQEALGPEAMFGAAAVGERTKTTIPAQAPGEQPVVTTAERWIDPKTGVMLSWKEDSPRNGMTMTVLNYSNAEPDAALFQVPEGYKLVDETGPFKVVHTRSNAAGGVTAGSGGPMGPRASGTCEEESCTLTFDLTSQRPMAVLTGAAYSGRKCLRYRRGRIPNGRQIPPMTRTQGATYRDSAGRTRTDKLMLQLRGGARTADEFAFDEIDDPVAGYQYIWTPSIAWRTGFRFKPDWCPSGRSPILRRRERTRFPTERLTSKRISVRRR